jgi:hypothetical protein
MSSWANRNIPRKRDISQIPEQLRPQIVPRALKPEIVNSEAFQNVRETVSNIIVNNSSNKSESIPSRQYTTKKVDLPSPTAIELKYNAKSYVFVILRHIRSVRDNDLWISSYNSIRKYYKNKIVIIDDNSSINTVNGRLDNTEVIYSEFPGAGEILPYYYFLKNKWADRLIFLHDSMFLNRYFIDKELEDDIKFHWFFHSGENKDNSKINLYLSLLNNNDEITSFFKNPQSVWRGCFGVASIVDYTVIDFLEQKYGLFTTLVLNIKSRKDREIFERVFGIVLFYEKIVDINCSNFGLITDYPGAFNSENNNYDTAKHIISQRGYDTAILKVWRGR